MGGRHRPDNGADSGQWPVLPEEQSGRDVGVSALTAALWGMRLDPDAGVMARRLEAELRRMGYQLVETAFHGEEPLLYIDPHPARTR